MVFVDEAGRFPRRIAAPGATTPARAILDQLPFGVAVFDRDLRFAYVNPVLLRINGLPLEAHLGRRVTDVAPAEGADRIETLMAGVLATGEPVLDEVVVGRRQNVPSGDVTSRASYVPYTVDGEVVGIVAVVEDLTAEHAGRRRVQLLLRCAEGLAGASTVDEVAETLLGQLVPHAAARGAVGLFEHDGRHLRIAAEVGYPEPTGGPWGRSPVTLEVAMPLTAAIATAATVVVVDDEPGPGDAGDAGDGGDPGDGSVIAVPIPHSGGHRLFGAFHLAWDAGQEVDEDDRSMFTTVGTLAGVALERIRSVEALALDRFRNALEAMLDDVTIGTAVRDDEGRIVDFEIAWVNERMRDGAGRGADELVGRRVLELYPAWVESGMFDAFSAVVNEGVPMVQREMGYVDETEGRTIEGWWDLQVVATGDGYLAVSRDVTEQVLLRREMDEAAAQAREEQLTVQILQQAALPAALPDLDGLRVAAAYHPATGAAPVGGDWYDAFELPDGSLGICIGDVAGHGAVTAGDMVRARNLVFAHATAGAEPGVVLARANDTLVRAWQGSTFATCCYAVVDPHRGELRWASAGHPPPLRTGPRGGYLEPTHGTVIGVFPGSTYETRTVPFAVGDGLVLYTDGLVESRRMPIDEGLKRLAATIIAHPEEHADPAALCERIRVTLIDADRVDDICMLAVSRTR